MKINWQERTSS